MNRHHRTVFRLPILAGSAAMLAATTAAPPEAAAFEAGPSMPACFRTAPLWNAPNGAIVSGVSDGPINTVITAIGEVRTHTMVSHGARGWAAHSTTLQPSSNTADLPVKPHELAAGVPGMTTINMGGAFAYWSGARDLRYQLDTRPVIRAPGQPFVCGNRCKSEGVADWLWFDIPFTVASSTGATVHRLVKGDAWAANTTFFSLGFINLAGEVRHLPYNFHQYMDGANKTVGMEVDTAVNRGIVCSQVPAYAYAHWVDEKKPTIAAGTSRIKAQSYTHAQTQAAGTALWGSLQTQCMSTSLGFWGDFAAFFGFVSKHEICNNLALQVLNCFFIGEDRQGGGCNNTSFTPWSNYQNAPTAPGAVSLSPDALLGKSGHPTSGTTVGPWAPGQEFALQWNGGGSTYGCYW